MGSGDYMLRIRIFLHVERYNISPKSKSGMEVSKTVDQCYRVTLKPCNDILKRSRVNFLPKFLKTGIIPMIGENRQLLTDEPVEFEK